jgi:hypothetical protein
MARRLREEHDAYSEENTRNTLYTEWYSPLDSAVVWCEAGAVPYPCGYNESDTDHLLR